jgi:hypothetical protein
MRCQREGGEGGGILQSPEECWEEEGEEGGAPVIAWNNSSAVAQPSYMKNLIHRALSERRAQRTEGR